MTDQPSYPEGPRVPPLDGMDLSPFERGEIMRRYQRRWLEANAEDVTPDRATIVGWALADLEDERNAAGIADADWPYPSTTAAGIEAGIAHRAELARIARAAGPEACDLWRLDRERTLWRADPRNPRHEAIRRADEDLEAFLATLEAPADPAPAADPSLSDPELPAGVSPERLDRYAHKYLELGDTDPTQEDLAYRLGVGERAIRQVGWDRIRARAEVLRGSGGTTG